MMPLAWYFIIPAPSKFWIVMMVAALSIIAIYMIIAALRDLR